MTHACIMSLVENANPVTVPCAGLLLGQHICHGPCGDPVEEDCCGGRVQARVSVPLHPEHEPRLPVQHLLHRRWAYPAVFTLSSEGQCMSSSSLRPVSVRMCVCGWVTVIDVCGKRKKENVSSRSEVDVWIPQVLWSWRSGTIWSFWSPGPRPTCPYMEIPPSWVLSSWLKVCHLTLNPRDAV